MQRAPGLHALLPATIVTVLRAAVLSGLCLTLAACGGNVQREAPVDGGVDASRDAHVGTRPDAEFSCPSSPPPTGASSCFGSGSTCSYPCGSSTSLKQTFVCERGTWRPMSYCEPPGASGTVGDACTSNETCDVTGDGVNYRAFGAFAGGSLFPSPVCLATCDDPAPELLQSCDGGRGVCVSTGAAGVCAPFCTFGNDGAPPMGGLVNIMCGPLARARATEWRGLCWGGCSADADCPTGNRCDPDRLMCVKTVPTPTKSIGDACDLMDASSASCVCEFNRTSGVGYCTKYCRVGETSCPAGFVCDPMLPEGDPAVVPTGIAGYCLKACANDGECVNSRCMQHAGVSTKTCTVE